MTDDLGSATLERIRRIAAERVTRINETTREAIRGAIVEGVDLGEGAAQLGARIAEAASLSPYRGELIARTETMHAWNASALSTYAEEGVTLVEAEDGDEDEECRERQARDNGYGPGIYTLEEAMAEEDHPNGTLAWSPVISVDEIAQLRQDVREAGLGGPEYSVEQIDASVEGLVDRATAAEPGVTDDIRAIGRAVDLNPNAAFELNGKTYQTLNARLKTTESTFRKVTGELEVQRGATLTQVEAGMRDNLRYTYISAPAQYDAAIRSATDRLMAAGYRPLKASNYWTIGKKRGYAGMNTNWVTPSGQVFEVQFHTQAGLELKEVTSHPLYERQRKLPEGSPEWNALQREIDAGWDAFRAENAGLGTTLDWLRDVFPEVKA